MKRVPPQLLLGIALLLLVVITRFYNLGVVPHGMTWDEVAIGYNGYAVLHTRRDEWLERLPVSFQSFGDYKAPLAIYANGFSTFLFGMNLTAVRTPFALAGVISIIGIYALLKLLLPKTPQSTWLSLFGMFLMIASPWHHHFSRVGFESGIALCFLVWMVVFLLWAFQTSASSKLGLILLTFSVLCGAGSLYTYHSAKVVTPLLFLSLLILYKKSAHSRLRELVASGALGIVALYPFLKDSLFGQGLARASSTVFATQPLGQALARTGQQWLLHLSPGFLIGGATDTLRHGDGVWGVLLPTTLALVLISCVGFFIKHSFSSKEKKVWVLGFLWMVIGIIPAAIGESVPHPNRALLALPGCILLATLGMSVMARVAKKLGSIYLKLTIGVVLTLHVFLFTAYLSDYYCVFAQTSASSFSDGYLEAFALAQQYEKGLDGAPTVEKILFTAEYGQPYIYALFVRKTNPIWYRGGSLVKYEFTQDITDVDLARNNALVVASPEDEIDVRKAFHTVFGSDGQPRFYFFLTSDSP
ncbi:MAG: hypothetical protein H6774_03860 [Pseudomonadales bacterium]|nr:hypothetical protein [Candidatus Woesebacteria bacterium]MCB9802198.1 hypothetical protein [Pseudomonadales bacterium]